LLTGIALVTISTRASLKRYHSFALTLGTGDAGDEWDFHRIGTLAEKSTVDKELAELRERLSKVDEWKQRRQDIEAELNKVWTHSGELAPPPYAEKDPESPDSETISEATSPEQ
jgi:ATP-binding cassette subfamily D (ALD) long-chain fatty acid import protein